MTKEITIVTMYLCVSAAEGRSWWWLIILIIIIVLLILILCVVCAVARNRGAKYPVGEKEKEAGREPMLGVDEKGFGEYARP